MAQDSGFSLSRLMGVVAGNSMPGGAIERKYLPILQADFLSY